MSEFGNLVEIIKPVLGPLKLREVREEWHDRNMQVTAIVPRHRELTLLARKGRKVICSLRATTGNVDVDRGRW